jgi:hypothetical protein
MSKTTKTAPKKLPAKKVAAIAKQVNAATKPPKVLKVVTGHKAGTLPGDQIENGVLMPRERTQARALWAICDGLKKTLKRPPARFEFRQAIQDFKGPDGVKTVNADSSSFQYFAWRKFYGIKGRSLGLYPKRNTFDVNTPAKKAATPKKPAAPSPVASSFTKAAPGKSGESKASKDARAARDKARRAAAKA